MKILSFSKYLLFPFAFFLFVWFLVNQMDVTESTAQVQWSAPAWSFSDEEFLKIDTLNSAIVIEAYNNAWEQCTIQNPVITYPEGGGPFIGTLFRQALELAGASKIERVYKTKVIPDPSKAAPDAIVKIKWTGDKYICEETTWNYNKEQIRTAAVALHILAAYLQAESGIDSLQSAADSINTDVISTDVGTARDSIQDLQTYKRINK